MPHTASRPLPDPPATLAHALAAHAAVRPDTVAVSYSIPGGGSEALSYAALQRRATRFAATLTTLRSRTPDQPFVLIALPNGLEYVVAFFACLYAGAVAVTFHPPTMSTRRAGHAWDERFVQILRDCEPAAVVTEARLRTRLDSVCREAGAHRPRLLGTRDESGTVVPQTPGARPEQLALLQYTSGSTSEPRGVMVSHANLVHNVAGVSRNLSSGPGQATVGWLPLCHDMGLIGMICHPLWAGMTVHMSSPAEFLRDPASWLHAISRTRAAITVAPDFGFALAARKAPENDNEDLDLSCLRHAICGAEPVRAGTIERFTKQYAPFGFDPHALMPVYGLAEATLCVSCLDRQAAPALREVPADALGRDQIIRAPDGAHRVTLVGCGRRFTHDTEIAIVDPVQRKRRRPAEVGEVWVRGPSVAGGYWNRQQESENTFRACLASGEGPFLRTGDLGVMNGGQLMIVGRLKDVIIQRGVNHYPQDIEATVESSHPFVSRAGVLNDRDPGTEAPDQVVVLCELARHGHGVDYDAIAVAVRSAVHEVHGIGVHAVAMLRTGAIPRTTSGKIRRQEGSRRWRTGEFRPVALWRRDSIPGGAGQ